MQLIDLTGQKFGRLTVLNRNILINSRITKWDCLCDCGSPKTVDGSKLKSGHTKSCGCYNLECITKRKTTHGLSSKRLYAIWSNMRKRCYYVKDVAYKYYGAKGIKVCPEWDKCEDFILWAMNNGYEDGLTLDRKENDKDYMPSNCRWVNFESQMRNTTRTLGVDKVREIRKLFKEGVRMKVICDLYNADPSNLYKIKKRITYKNVF